MVTLGNGATKAVSDQISSLGSNLLWCVRPAPGTRTRQCRCSGLQKADVDVLRSQVSGLDEVVPVAGSSVTVVAGKQQLVDQRQWHTNGYLKAGTGK